MAIKTTLARSILALTLATAPMITGMIGSVDVAYAKGGNGGGSGGNGGGSDHGRSSSDHGKGHGRGKSTSGKSHVIKTQGSRTAKSVKIKEDVRTPDLSSLNRNYHAYLNSNDPRMTAVAAFAVAYAEFENENGVDAVPTYPTLSDEALRDALAGFTKDGVVTEAMVDEAKSILGVGPEVGKIDQIRGTLADPESAE